MRTTLRKDIPNQISLLITHNQFKSNEIGVSGGGALVFRPDRGLLANKLKDFPADRSKNFY